MVASVQGNGVLLLGCGLVAPPIIEYLCTHSIKVVVASRTAAKAEPIRQRLQARGQMVPLVETYDIEQDVKDSMKALSALVEKHQPALIISLIPYIYHVQAAQVAIRFRRHFCTSSYVSPAMQELDSQAKELGLFFLNECGVDPGLDHMSAMRVIHSIPEGSKLVSFRSICGGLPSPQANNNPFGYKFSWSPRGVLLASNNSAVIRRDGEIVSVPGSELFARPNYFSEFIETVGELEWYYNRDSVSYLDIYNIPETSTIIRGTYRYPGWCKTLQTIKTLGLTAVPVTEELSSLTSASALAYARIILGLSEDTQNVVEQLEAKLGFEIRSDVMPRLEWLGLLDDSLIVPDHIGAPIDFMTWLMDSKLSYAPGEKDMICMQHEFEIEHSPRHRETKTSTLIDLGLQPEGFSSMARTVSLPLAMAVRALLEGRISLSGVIRPVMPEVYNPVLDEMEQIGIKFEDKTLAQLIWVRSEVKVGEERVPVVPCDVQKLVAAGYRVHVERSPHRAFDDEEFEKAGAVLVPEGSWVSAPHSAIIVGLKELPEAPVNLKHRHIYFAHCFKGQGGWKEILQRFINGGGFLWDLEFLKHPNGRRVAAFGRAAGIVGCALGVIQWACRKLGQEMPQLSSWKDSGDLVNYTKALLSKIPAAQPKVLVLGALGRCGGGAVWFAESLGLVPIQWDLAETKKGGPFHELLEVEILVNCIYLSEKIPAFVSRDMLSSPRRALSTFVDVSCDTENPNNPFPIYDRLTTLASPVLTVPVKDCNPVDVIAIDHLPTLIPSESSAEFSEALIPHLLEVAQGTPVWEGAEQLFYEKCSLARQ